MFSKEYFVNEIKTTALTLYAEDIDNLGTIEKYMVVSKIIMDITLEKWKLSKDNSKKMKKAYYLSAEYLLGRLIGSNIMNLGINTQLMEALSDLNMDYNELENCEEDAGLGNGGLGRLAACLLDSAASHEIQLHGYGIRYEFGLFKQKIIDGCQDEKPDEWLKYGYPWEIKRLSETKTVKFDGHSILAIPYDIPVIGYDSNTVNTLRIWGAEPVNSVDLSAFNEAKYDLAQSESNFARSISMVLYPNDNNTEGKILRLKQEYFFVSASIQDLIYQHIHKNERHIMAFPDFHAIHLNDTHPALAIAEFMRILTYDIHMSWKESWDLTIRTFSYTNHTIMAEALEQWDRELFSKVLPEVSNVIEKMNYHIIEALKFENHSDETISKLSILSDKYVRMTNLSILGSHSVNGVAKLHSKLLIERELKEFYKVYPNRFNNKTNGITQRRWLELCNPQLSSFITELLGSKNYLKNLDELKNLKKFSDDTSVLQRFTEVKHQKKLDLCDFLYKKEGVILNPNTIFDVQVKRMHEYKRQLLNILHVLDLYNRLKDNPSMDFNPITFIFGAKSAPGYHRAKSIIRFINEVAKLINGDSSTKGRLTVHFVENYNVTAAEKIIPAADISEQISTAGMEASGTGNMKFMLNGAATIGTYDGANIEIFEAAGLENNFLFGATVEELNEIKKTYDPKEYYWNTPGLKRAFDSLIDISFPGCTQDGFGDIYNSILNGSKWDRPDVYFIMKDFESYRNAHLSIDMAYKNKYGFAKKCWNNISSAGNFSSDRTVKEYAKEIWRI